MTAPVRSLVPPEPFIVETISPGVTLRRLYPGALTGPDDEVQRDIPGGQTWSENFLLGGPDDPFQMLVPDIRMPPNQLWPLHWHDCWTVVVILQGKCSIGDWHMVPGDVFVAAPSIEYGPLLVGPRGCRLLEIFARLHLSPGGYSPEYRDHPTLQGGNHVFKPREGINLRNHGHSSLAVDGAEGLWKTRLSPGWAWDLGGPGDPDRGVVRNVELAPGEAIAARSRGDCYAALVIDGSIDCGDKILAEGDVLIAERGATIGEMLAGRDGAQLLEHFRTARAL